MTPPRTAKISTADTGWLEAVAKAIAPAPDPGFDLIMDPVS